MDNLILEIGLALGLILVAMVIANRFGLSTTKRLLDAIDAGTTLDFRARYHSRFPSIY